MATKMANRSVTTAMAIAGRSSRACDVCANKSARLYCAADEAYLCDRCDTQVHSANALALRHERVRLAPNGTPMKIPRTTSSDTSTKEPAAAFKVMKSLSQDILPTFKSSKSASNHKDAEVPQKSSKKKHQNLHLPPTQVLPCRKRSRTSRPHPLHHVKLDSCNSISNHQGSVELFSHLKAPKSSVKVEREAPAAAAVESVKVKVEQLPLFDLFDTDDFLTDCPQEVPSFITVMDYHQHTSSDSSGSDREFSCSDFSSEVQYETSDHSVPASDSGGFAAYFKGKAGDVDQFLVPDSCAFDYSLDDSRIVGDMCVEIDSSVSFAGDACFVPGEIPGLDGFEDFGCVRNLTDGYAGLSFDLPLSGGSEAFEGDVNGDTSEAGGLSSNNNGGHVVEMDQSLMEGPFAKFFAGKGRSSSDQKQSGMSPDKIKDAAKEILRCCREGLSEEEERLVPSLRLNYDDVLTAWSDRGDPWVDFKRAADDSTSTGNDACLVPSMGQGACDDGQSGGHREAKVLRYKEKRANRLFSKKIRYEVRKLNAERRPRMKGRFVKRTGEL